MPELTSVSSRSAAEASRSSTIRVTAPDESRTTRPKSAPIVWVRVNVSTAPAAAAAVRSLASSRRLAGSVRGWSPFSTSTSPSKPARADRALRAASPVPSGRSCATASTPGGRIARRDSSPAGTTTTVRAGSSSADRSHHPFQHRPAAGRVQQLRHGRLHARSAPGGKDDTCERRGRHVGAGVVGAELGRLDSNQGSRDQNPLPYHLATPQRARLPGRTSIPSRIQSRPTPLRLGSSE